MKLKLHFIPCLCFLLLVLTADAQNTFSKVYYDSTDATYGYSIVPSFDNGYLIAGSKSQSGLIYKIDSAGTILWDKKYTNGSLTEFYRIIATRDSGFVVAGYTYSASNWDLICMKIDFSGDTVWTRKFGGVNFESAISVEQTTDEGFILSGRVGFSSAPYYKTLILKLDSSGNMEWNSVISTGGFSNYIYSIKQTRDSGYVVIGVVDSSNHSRLILFKLNAIGTYFWGKKYLDSPYDLQGLDIEVLSDGFACLVSNGNDYAMMKTDTSGNILWIKLYQGAGFGICQNCIQPRLIATSDGGYAFVKGMNPLFGTGQSMLKIDSVGNLQWYQEILMSPSDLAVTEDSGFMVVGNGPLFGVRSMSTITNPQIGIVRTDSLGNNGSCTFSFTISVATDTFAVSALAYTVGTSSAISNEHPVISMDTLVTDTGCVPFLGGFEEVSMDNFISIFPNPASSRINFSFAKSARQYNLSIRNVLGQEVYSRLLIGEETRNFSLDADFSPGIYIVALSDDRSVYSKKLVIEY